MNLSNALQGYIFALTSEGYSHDTLIGCRSSINRMIEYLGDREIGSITTDDLRGFMNFLVTKYVPERRNNPVNTEPLSTASHHRYWKVMRSFFKWVDRDLGTGRPDLPIKMPHWESGEIIPFSEEEIKILLKGCEYITVPAGKRRSYRLKRPLALRDKAIILTLLDTGVRVGELTRLRMCDVNLENGEVYVWPFHVKKTRSRPTYLWKVSQEAI